jgi:hypothetical protein
MRRRHALSATRRSCHSCRLGCLAAAAAPQARQAAEHLAGGLADAGRRGLRCGQLLLGGLVQVEQRGITVLPLRQHLLGRLPVLPELLARLLVLLLGLSHMMHAMSVAPCSWLRTLHAAQHAACSMPLSNSHWSDTFLNSASNVETSLFRSSSCWSTCCTLLHASAVNWAGDSASRVNVARLNLYKRAHANLSHVSKFPASKAVSGSRPSCYMQP